MIKTFVSLSVLMPVICSVLER